MSYPCSGRPQHQRFLLLARLDQAGGSRARGMGIGIVIEPMKSECGWSQDRNRGGVGIGMGVEQPRVESLLSLGTLRFEPLILRGNPITWTNNCRSESVNQEQWSCL